MILAIDEIKEKVQTVFQKELFVERAYLFGSYAEGTSTSQSDVDIFVTLSGEVGLHFFSLYESLSEALGKPVDVLTDNEVRQLKDKTALERAILLYEKR